MLSLCSRCRRCEMVYAAFGAAEAPRTRRGFSRKISIRDTTRVENHFRAEDLTLYRCEIAIGGPVISTRVTLESDARMQAASHDGRRRRAQHSNGDLSLYLEGVD